MQDGQIPRHLLVSAKDAPVFGFLSTCPPRVFSKPPRQVVSDMKWEGETWISSKKLSKAVTKRSRSDSSDTDSEEDDMPCDTDQEDQEDHQDRPVKPKDPEEDRDEARRSKDKDCVPSRQTYVWDKSAKEWVLKERPRLHVAGMFFSYAPVPPTQVALLKHILDSEHCPVDEEFLKEELVPRLNRTHKVSLRSLDWLVVDYSREKNVAYRRYVPVLKREMIVVVHQLYSNMRDRWRRRRFDCFRRRHRIYFDLNGDVYSTTVAQLHFFFVSRMYGFLDYAAQNIAAIEAHMKKTLTDTAEAKSQARRLKQKYRRKPLVQKAAPRVFVSDVQYKLSFQFEAPAQENGV